MRPHELYSPLRLTEVTLDILEQGRIVNPIIVDSRSLTILDGHHRFEALRRLGVPLVPVALLHYENDEVEVRPRRPGIPVSKRLVVATAMAGRRLPHKTTRHILPELPEVDMPLSVLVGIGGEDDSRPPSVGKVVEGRRQRHGLGGR